MPPQDSAEAESEDLKSEPENPEFNMYIEPESEISNFNKIIASKLHPNSLNELYVYIFLFSSRLKSTVKKIFTKDGLFSIIGWMCWSRFIFQVVLVFLIFLLRQRGEGLQVSLGQQDSQLPEL
uniref:Uncharacterized protein n=1 Tax=Theileria parva TaxID=5875 RepID=Q4MYR7_THEPA|eukprot:XP_762898.1 hypothetical protein [Theileria parva strain Muguga]